MRLFLLTVETHDYSNSSFGVVGVFSSKEELEQYIDTDINVVKQGRRKGERRAKPRPIWNRQFSEYVGDYVAYELELGVPYEYP